MRLGLIGAGNMASALARGIGEPVLVYDVDAGEGQRARGGARRRGRGLECRAGRARRRARALPQAEAARRGGRGGGRPRTGGRLDPRRNHNRAGRRRLPRCLDLPLHPEHADRGAARGALLHRRPRRIGRPRGRDSRPDGSRRRGDPARRRAPDRARDGADELRTGVHGPGGGELRGGRGRARPRSRRRHAHGRRDDGRHGGLPRTARLRRPRACARGSRRRAG